MNILRREGYRRMPWKNGLGVTEEVAASPLASTVETFDWRISIAHVGTDGPFSLFPGIDRTIALLDGAGLTLDLPDDATASLAPDGDPFSFRGEWVVSSRNTDGATIDLNVMTRRGRCSHRLLRYSGPDELAYAAKSDVVVVTNVGCAVLSEGVEVALARFDGIVLSAGERIVLRGPSVEFLAAELILAS